MAFRSEFTNLMQDDMYAWFFESYNQLNPVYPQIFEVVGSDSAYHKHTTGIGMGQLSERKEGDEIIASNPLEGFTVYSKNRTFSDSYSLTAEFVKDTPKQKIANVMMELSKGWGQGLINSKEVTAAKVFNNGGLTAGHDIFNGSITGTITDPTGDLAYDGKPFFNLTGNARSSKSGSTYYNGHALNLSSDNLQTVYSLMTDTNNEDERGDKISLIPDTLLIPPALKFTAKNILQAEHIVGSANNDINTSQDLLSPIQWQYLTDTNAWFVGLKGKGLKFMNRQPAEIDFYQNETNKKFYATIDARWGIEMNNWRYWSGSNFSTS